MRPWRNRAGIQNTSLPFSSFLSTAGRPFFDSDRFPPLMAAIRVFSGRALPSHSFPCWRCHRGFSRERAAFWRWLSFFKAVYQPTLYIYFNPASVLMVLFPWDSSPFRGPPPPPPDTLEEIIPGWHRPPPSPDQGRCLHRRLGLFSFSLARNSSSFWGARPPLLRANGLLFHILRPVGNRPPQLFPSLGHTLGVAGLLDLSLPHC